MVDESQNLSVAALEELRMLSNFQLGSHPLLQVLLLGQPEFRDNLQGHPQLEQLRQRVIAAHHLDPMEPQEIEPYIMHRLALVGWNGSPSFEPRVFEALYTATGGVPRRINQIVNRLLILGAVDRKQVLDGVMLAAIIGELTRDGALPLGSPVASEAHKALHEAVIATMPRAPATAAPVPATSAGWEPALAAQAAQIGELQAAVIELAHGHDTTPANDPAHLGMVAALQEANGRFGKQVDGTGPHAAPHADDAHRMIERDEAQRAAA